MPHFPFLHQTLPWLNPEPRSFLLCKMSFFRPEYILIKYRDFSSQLPKIHPFLPKISKVCCKLFPLWSYRLFQHTEKPRLKLRISCLLFSALPASQTRAHKPHSPLHFFKMKLIFCYFDVRYFRRIMPPRKLAEASCKRFAFSRLDFQLVDLYFCRIAGTEMISLLCLVEHGEYCLLDNSPGKRYRHNEPYSCT